MLKTIIRLRNNMVMVFDESGEEIPEYQGYYHVVKEKIYANAGGGTVFNNWFGLDIKPEKVKMKGW
jgi:hypothetical protein